MVEFLLQNWGTLVVGAVVLAAVFAIIFKMIKDKKEGRSSCSCGCGGCSGCGGSGCCHTQSSQK